MGINPANPPIATYEPLGLSTMVRRGCLFGVACLAFILPQGVDDPILRNAVPWFVALLVLQLAAALWPRHVDAGAPPVLFGLGGLLAASGTTASLVTFLYQGYINLNWVSGLTPAESEALIMRVLFAQCLGTVCYYAGYYHPQWGKRAATWLPTIANHEWVPSRLRNVCIAISVVFLASYAYFQSKLGVSMLDPTQLFEGKAIWRQDGATTMLRGIQLGVLPAFLLFAYTVSKPGWVKTAMVVAALGLVSYLTIRVGQRGFTIMALVPPVLVYHYLRRKVPISVFVLGLIAVIFASNILLSWRVSDAHPRPGVTTDEKATLLERVEHNLVNHELERQRFQVSAFLFDEFPKNRDFLYGKSWLGLLVMPIPRFIWPEKWGAFIWRDSAIMLVIVGAPNPTPLLALLYVNFSWFGIVFGLLLWGAFHRAMYEWMLLRPRDPTVILYYVVVLEYVSPTLAGASNAIQYLLPLWIGLRLISRPVPAQPDGSRAPAGARAMAPAS